jgi:uncharacterized membrane protein YuzA (DUF378 family)
MQYLKALALLLVIVGGANWLLVSVAQFDLVAALTGSEFGEVNILSQVVYALVGVAAIALIPTLVSWVTRDEAVA